MSSQKTDVTIELISDVHTRSDFLRGYDFSKITDASLNSLEIRAKNHTTGEIHPYDLMELVKFFKASKELQASTTRGLQQHA